MSDHQAGLTDFEDSGDEAPSSTLSNVLQRKTPKIVITRCEEDVEMTDSASTSRVATAPAKSTLASIRARRDNEVEISGVYGFGMQSRNSAVLRAEAEAVLFVRRRPDCLPAGKYNVWDSVEELANWREIICDVCEPPADTEPAEDDHYRSMVEVNSLAKPTDRHVFDFCVLDFYGVPHCISRDSPYLGKSRRDIWLMQARSLDEYIDYVRTGILPESLLKIKQDNILAGEASGTSPYCRLDNELSHEELFAQLQQRQTERDNEQGSVLALSTADSVGLTKAANKLSIVDTSDIPRDPATIIAELQAQLAKKDATIKRLKEPKPSTSAAAEITSKPQAHVEKPHSATQKPHSAAEKSKTMPIVTGYNKRPERFETAAHFVHYYAGQYRSEGQDEKTAKERAVLHLKQEASSLMEQHWKPSPRFHACYACGKTGHRGAACPDKDSLKCVYCDRPNHNVKVCRTMHSFCYRCACFGHYTVRDGDCVENGKDQTWDQCKSLGIYTCQPKFQRKPDWDGIAADIKIKFGDYLDVVRPALPRLACYALYQADNRLCAPPKPWLDLVEATERADRLEEAARKRQLESEQDIDIDDSASAVSKRHRADTLQNTSNADQEVQIVQVVNPQPNVQAGSSRPTGQAPRSQRKRNRRLQRGHQRWQDQERGSAQVPSANRASFGQSRGTRGRNRGSYSRNRTSEDQSRGGASGADPIRMAAVQALAAVAQNTTGPQGNTSVFNRLG